MEKFPQNPKKEFAIALKNFKKTPKERTEGLQSMSFEDLISEYPEMSKAIESCRTENTFYEVL